MNVPKTAFLRSAASSKSIESAAFNTFIPIFLLCLEPISLRGLFTSK